MADDDNNSGGSTLGTVAGGGVGLVGGGLISDRVLRGGVVKKLTSPEFHAKVGKGTPEEIKEALKAVGIDEKHHEAVAGVLKHEEVVKVSQDLTKAMDEHQAHAKKIIDALKTGKVGEKEVESVTFVAEGGTHTMQVKIKGEEKALELKGIKILPKDVEAGKPITDIAKIKALGETHVPGKASWLHQVAPERKLSAEHVEKVTFKPVPKKGNVPAHYEAEIHLTPEGMKHVHGEKPAADASKTIPVKVKELPKSVTGEAGKEVTVVGEDLKGLAAAGEHGWLHQAALDAQAVVREGGIKPLQGAMRKALGFGGAFKLAGTAGKAGVVIGTAAATFAGAKLVGGMFGGSHADRVSAERAQPQLEAATPSHS